MKKMVESHFLHPSHSDRELELELPTNAIAQLGQGMVEDLTFSADSQYLAVASRTGLWWYSLTSMCPTALWEKERGMVSTVSCSANGKWFAAGNLDGLLKLWDIQSGVSVGQLDAQNDVVTTIPHTFSLDGRWFAMFSKGRDLVYIVNPEEPRELITLGDGRPLKNRRPAIKPLAFSPDNQLLANVSPTDDMSSDFVSVWNLETKECIAYFTDYPDFVYGLSFSPCGRFLSIGCCGGILRTWNVFTQKLERAQIDYGKYRMYPCYSLEGKLLAAGFFHYDNRKPVDIWDVENQEKLDEIKTNGNVSCGRFSESGEHLAIASGDEVKIWTLEKPDTSIPLSIRGHSGVVESVMFFPDGKTLVSGHQRASRILWDLTNCYSQRPRPIHRTVAPNVIDSSPIEKIYYASHTDKNIFKIRDLRNAKCLMEWRAPEKPLWRTVTLAPKADLLVIGHRKGTLIVWDVESRKKRYTFTSHTRSILSTAFSPDGKWLASTSSDRTVRVWDIRSGKEVCALPNYPPLDTTTYKVEAPEILKDLNPSSKTNKQLPYSVVEIVFSPCGNFIAGGLFGEVRLWNATTYDIHMAILLPQGCQRPYALVFSPCGRYLASGSWWQGTDKVSIRLWEVATGDNIATFWGHPTDIQDLAFSLDGEILASASFDGTILLWDVKPYLAA